ncbi:MAG: DUF3035 domain-containing protein, partial [Pseudomonadota bacterium]
MVKSSVRFGLFGVLLVGLSACGGTEDAPPAEAPRDTVLSRINSGGGTSPDEFAIVTNRPLQLTEDLLSQPLPVPTPGGGNRADLTPQQDALAALGARPNPTRQSERALIAAAGVRPDPNIRAELAAQDAVEGDPSRLRLLVRLWSDD